MGLYRVKFSAKSYSVLPPGRKVKFTIGREENPGSVMVRNKNVVNLLGESFSNELIFVCEFQANSIQDAIGVSGATVNQILDNLALVTGGPAYDIKVLKAYETTAGVELREFWQFF